MSVARFESFKVSRARTVAPLGRPYFMERISTNTTERYVATRGDWLRGSFVHGSLDASCVPRDTTISPLPSAEDTNDSGHENSNEVN